MSFSALTKFLSLVVYTFGHYEAKNGKKRTGFKIFGLERSGSQNVVLENLRSNCNFRKLLG